MHAQSMSLVSPISNHAQPDVSRLLICLLQSRHWLGHYSFCVHVRAGWLGEGGGQKEESGRRGGGA